jgi:formate hydrogenlyase subunit 3/multisubunit Na+/H+ antiporter MnhD subunit
MNASSYRLWLVTSSVITLGVALAGGWIAIWALNGAHLSLNVHWLLPLGGLHLRIDPLSALFDLLTATTAIAVAIYMMAYFGRHVTPRFTLALVPVFVAVMLLVPMAATYYDFWFFWELMAVTSAVLVLTNYRDATTRNAGLFYIAYTQVGFALILASTAYLNAHSGTGFLDGSGSHLEVLSNAVFVLSLLGFTSKAGLLPLSSWLQLAHPEAPTPVSALMSAAMVNLGIYGVLRIDLAGPGQSWWGVLMIVIGLASALYGALHALISSDIKRLLAFSTSENLGIIITALGAYELLRTTHFVVVAEIALAGAILHLIGHALFKSLAFISAGQLVDESSTRDLNRMGHMIQRTRLASAGFGIASLGATGLPLGAGFIGEWLLLQALIHTSTSAPILLRIVMPIAVALLALTVGLKVAAMTKAFGIGVLSRQRGPGSGETVRTALAKATGATAIALLTFANLVFATVPSIVAPLYQRVARYLMPREKPIHIGSSIMLAPLRGAISPLAIFIEVVGSAIVVGMLVERHIRLQGRIQSGDLWNCGGGAPRIRMQYSSASFAQPLETIFGNAVRVQEHTDVDHADPNGLIVTTMVYRRSRADIVATTLHRLVGAIIGQGSNLVRRAHPGNIRLYILYGAIGLLLIFMVTR